MVKVCARGPARAARGGRDSGARAASPTRSPASMLASSAGCARRTSPNNSPPPPRSTPTSRRSSPSMSSVVRWTRSTTSATCPSSRTSITYVPCPRRAVAGRPIYGKSDPPERPEGLGRGLGRRMRERGARFAGGHVRGTTPAAHPRVHAPISAHRDPRLHPLRARRRVPPAAPPRRSDWFFCPLEGAPRAPTEITRPNFIIHSPRRQRVTHPDPSHRSLDVTGQVHPHGLPRRGCGYHRPGERRRRPSHRHPPG